MKIGVSINLFNSEELLEQCLQNIRDIADIIVVVYSNISNFNTDKKDLKPLLDELISKKLIDKSIEYIPTFNNCINNGATNEINKRNIALEFLKKNYCNYILDMDCDEFYEKEKLMESIKYINYMGYDSAFCNLRTYYKFADCEIIPLENYYVPCIYKIQQNSKFELIEKFNFPVDCDQTRKIKTKYPYVFSRNELEMHHFSYVRKDIESITSKYKNSSCIVDYDNLIFNENINNWENYIKGGLASFSINGKTINFKKTQIVKNLFNITL